MIHRLVCVCVVYIGVQSGIHGVWYPPRTHLSDEGHCRIEGTIYEWLVVMMMMMKARCVASFLSDTHSPYHRVPGVSQSSKPSTSRTTSPPSSSSHHHHHHHHHHRCQHHSIKASEMLGNLALTNIQQKTKTAIKQKENSGKGENVWYNE